MYPYHNGRLWSIGVLGKINQVVVLRTTPTGAERCRDLGRGGAHSYHPGQCGGRPFCVHLRWQTGTVWAWGRAPSSECETYLPPELEDGFMGASLSIFSLCIFRESKSNEHFRRIPCLVGTLLGSIIQLYHLWFIFAHQVPYATELEGVIPVWPFGVHETPQWAPFLRKLCHKA